MLLAFLTAQSIENAVPPPSLQVDVRHFSILSQWKDEYSIETILVGLRNEMTSGQNRKLAQPPEGTNF